MGAPVSTSIHEEREHALSDPRLWPTSHELSNNKERNMKWVIDEDGDVGISFWSIVTLFKYKNSVIPVWFKKFPEAPRYL